MPLSDIHSFLFLFPFKTRPIHHNEIPNHHTTTCNDSLGGICLRPFLGCYR